MLNTKGILSRIPGIAAGPTSRLIVFAALLSAAGVMAGCSGDAGKSTPDARPAETASKDGAVKKVAGDPVAGKVIYEKYCHFCHGREGLGDGPVGIAISPHPADFVNDTKRMSKTDEELFESITYGIEKEIGGEEMAMPRWMEILSEKERWDVLAYVRKLEREGKEKKEAELERLKQKLDEKRD